MIDQATSLAAIDGMIAHHTAMLDALIKVRELMEGVQPRLAEIAKPLQLPAPAPQEKKRRARGGEPIIHDIEGADVEVTQLQSDILDVLNAAPGTDPAPILAKTIAEKIGGITPHGVNYAIKDLRERMARAGCKAEINGYRGRGFALEIERGEE